MNNRTKTSNSQKKFSRIDALKIKSQYRSLFDYTHDAILIIKDFKILDVNPACIKMFGYENKEELIGLNPWSSKISPKYQSYSKDSLVLGKSMLQQALNGSLTSFEWKHIKKDDTECVCEVSINTLEVDGKIYLQAIARDITDRIRTEEELKESETRLNEAQQIAHIGSWELDLITNILYWSDEVYRLFDLAPQQFAATYEAFLDYIHPDDREFVDNAYTESVKNKTPYDIVHRLLLKDGTVIFVNECCKTYYDDAGKAVRSAGTIQDITERRQAEQELNKAYKEISELKDKIQAENIYLRKAIKPSNLHKDIVGTSPQIKEVVEKALQVAPMDSNVLLLGETGTGKELITKGIHDASKRKEKTLVTVNCAAIPESLIESELFGHEKGAFTDAHTKKIGLFEIADKSTLFLDEIGDMPYNLQSKLLRVIENREILRIGRSQPVKIDVRIIAATNQDLPSLVKDKKFRQDLYYRLNVFPIELPPLRTRKQDIKQLVEKFVEYFNQHMGRKVTTIPKKTMEILEKYSWPGNVRELRNIIERSMITSTGSTVKVDQKQMSQPIEAKMTTLEDVERSHIREVLGMTYWKISGKGGAAEILGINRNTLNSRIKKLGIKKNS